jgi:hypothetical protein
MNANFYTLVQARISSFLLMKGMKLEECKEIDNGKTSAVFYESSSCKLAIYKSLIDGEVNFKVGLPTASNLSLNDGTQWFFQSALKNGAKDLSLEALLARVPDSPKGSEEQLDQIALDLRSNFDELVRALRTHEVTTHSAG